MKGVYREYSKAKSSELDIEFQSVLSVSIEGFIG